MFTRYTLSRVCMLRNQATQLGYRLAAERDRDLKGLRNGDFDSLLNGDLRGGDRPRLRGSGDLYSSKKTPLQHKSV